MIMQHNCIDGKVKNARVCRNEIFNQIITYIKSNPSIIDFIITRDINQDIGSSKF